MQGGGGGIIIESILRYGVLQYLPKQYAVEHDPVIGCK
jgi:hypothetical protein